MKKIVIILFLILSFSFNYAQVTPSNSTRLPPTTTIPKTRTLQIPPESSNSQNNTGIRPSKINSSNTVIVKNIGTLNTIELSTKLSPPSNLKRIIKINRDFESNTPSWITQFEDGELNYSNANIPKWEFNFVWFNIPKKAVCAKVEISDFPFSINENRNLNPLGVIKLFDF